MIGVYPIVDVGPSLSPQAALSTADAFSQAGAKWIQLRAKNLGAGAMVELARAMLLVTRPRGARLIINDRPDVAVIAGADGVHLGQDDLPPKEVRPWLLPKMILGVSCHGAADLERAVADGVADYCGYGPVFVTTTKANPDPVVGLEGLREAAANAGLPLVAIGGITRATLAAVARTGVAGAALIADLQRGPDPGTACQEAIARFQEGRA